MKTITPTQLVQMRGNIDKAVIEDNVLLLIGWAASVNAGPVESLRVSYSGKEFTDFEMAFGIKSPDVKEIFPNLECGQKSRFRIRIPLNLEEQQQIRDSLIVVTPLFKEGEGGTILYLLEPSLPLPSEDDSELMIWIGSNALDTFSRTAIEFLGYFLEMAALKPTDSVLDVGCGMGRIAYTLAYYLAPTTRYEGFDIMEPLIQWAHNNITPRFPNFNFRRVDIYNKLYNHNGTLQATEFVFPYEDESFDFVFLGSVFTHIPACEVRHYLEEIYRVLKLGGRCLCTVFMHNEESAKLIAAGKSSANLVHEIDDYFATSLDMPEMFTGFKEDLLLEWICDRGFTVKGKYYGLWCGRSEHTSYQDILILHKD
ncbi:class I SAM-dependent methyltransferase [Argonema antarcticum]|uniref:class I SAM-dependent methyltransferase n=1 Tax=Argonema antarcticum TaxID=2942763 RepID=UPI002011BAB8|nr:class I SAM-dependent methyltransferase [Argonema antarcticum]MCL1470958.1 class I SAM-dependent methyltransferase [Argonema antarcticum A004/B2]